MGLLKRLFGLNPVYTVIKSDPERGCEVRFNGAKYWVHVTDQKKWDAHVKQLADNHKKAFFRRK